MIPRLVVFDLDGTLAPPDGGLSTETLAQLRTLASRGVWIAIASGKPAFYLAGFFRMANFHDVILIGENGLETLFGTDLPPKKRTAFPLSPEVKAALARVRAEIDGALGDAVYYQPNSVAVTPCPLAEGGLDRVEEIIEAGGYRSLLDVYRFAFCFDILPRGASKAEGVRALGEELGIPAAETVAIGNEDNDYPMFEYAALALGIRVPDPARVDRNFERIEDALAYLLTLTEGARP